MRDQDRPSYFDGLRESSASFSRACPAGSNDPIGRIGRQHKQCPSYDGKGSFGDFLVQFEMISEFNSWSIEVMAQELALSLKGEAVAVLADLDPARRKNYHSLVEVLKARYEP